MKEGILLSLLFGSGALLALTAQPHGRPRVSLQSRLQTLRPDWAVGNTAPRRRVFRTEIFEDGLRPAMEAAGKVFMSVASRLGLDLSDTAARLSITGDHGGLPLFLGQKLAGLLIGLALLPSVATIAPSIPHSPWLSLVLAIAGFVTPDLVLRSKSEARRIAFREGLARFADLLSLSVSAGLGLETAIDEAARSSSGEFFAELRSYLRDARLGNRPSSSAIAAMSSDLRLPDAETLAFALSSAESQGLPVMQVLRTQARAIRERRRLEVIETAQRADIRMRILIGLVILPAFFVLIMYPAAVQLLQITAR
jgi:tight adherence protein C